MEDNMPENMTEQQRHHEKIRRYYKGNKEKLQKMARDRFKQLSEEEKKYEKRIC